MNIQYLLVLLFACAAGGMTYPKAIEDVRKYATVDFPVMEISITDDIANAGDTRKSLAERITGTGHATRFAGREWLYSPAAKKILKRSWHIEAEPSDKPLRHKGTDLVRLETPLPAITVYAVKGAPTGETSWDNIDLTLREISEATVEKQEEALDFQEHTKAGTKHERKLNHIERL